MQQDGKVGQQTAVIYARVSSKEQEAEGFSIDAQLDLNRGYARKHGFTVLNEYVDVESASVSGRTKFGEMLTYFKKNRNKCTAILVEKTDRLYRNAFDAGKVGELGITVHFVKEGVVLSSDSKSSDHLLHDVKVVMARHYTRVLSEDTLKGMTQKAKSGLYPSAAPHGYRNVEGPDGRRIIVPNSDAPTITKLFEEFATGEYSVKALAAKTRSEGRSIGGKPLPKSNLHRFFADGFIVATSTMAERPTQASMSRL